MADKIDPRTPNVQPPTGGDEQPPAPDASPSSLEGLGWHEPPISEGASRPVIVERWFVPETGAPVEATPTSQPTPRQTVPTRATEPEPEVEPAEESAALLDSLFAAEQTVPETFDGGAIDGGQETVAEAEDESPLIEEPAPDAESTPTPDATSPQPALTVSAASAAPIEESVAADAVEPPRKPSQFEEVEQKVKALLERHRAGELTRDQLQQELRGLMILDDQGRWWMLGLESNRWYYYDGAAWVPGTPPGYDEAVRGSGVRTETGLQGVVGESAAGLAPDAATLGEEAAPLGAEDESVLPLRVPQDDPGATLVSPNSPFLEPLRGPEPTLPHADAVGAGAEDVTLSSTGFDPSVTLASGAGLEGPAGGSEPTLLSGLAPDLQAPTVPPVTPPPVERRPKHQINQFPQPDYSAAFGSARNRNTYAKWAIRFAVFGSIGAMAITLLVLLLMIGYYFAKVDQYAAAVDSLETRTADFETTLILNANGDTLAEFNNPDTGARKEVPLPQISPWLIHATISTENETFYTDPGFSVTAIVRAAYQNLREGGTVSGASTITQQLARALVLETEFASQRTTERKIVEVIVASEIKRKYTKNEILQIYLNEIFYGNFSYGIEAAAHQYFHKAAADLNPAEAAFLAGLPQSPAQYDPVVNREAAIGRMRTVLRLMAESNGTGCIYIEHADETQWAVPEGGGLCIYSQMDTSGNPVYYYKTPSMAEPQEMTLDIALVETAAFTPPTFQTTHPHFVNYVWQQLEDTYGPQAIYAAGFRVYTSLDERIQTATEQSVTRRLSELQARGIDATNASVVVIRPSDGAVLAMVGSADYYNEDIDGQVNVAFTAQQPGSSIKPLVYLAALEPDNNQYWTPATVIWDVYTDFNGYIPVNYDSLYHGPKSVREALANSLNIPAVKTLQFTGLLDFTEMAQAAGITWPVGNPIERNAGLPTALGAVEIRLFDLTRAFGMLANYGRAVDPYSIVLIEDSKGNQVYQVPTNKQGAQVVAPEYAYLITDILADNQARVPEFGGGWPMELGSGRPAAVKTGTTNDSRDVLTVGYTPQLVVGVWVGNSDNRPMYGVSGIQGAAPIWNDVMEAALSDQPVQAFQRPSGVVDMEVCADTGAQPTQDCAGRTYTEIFASSAPPPPASESMFRTLRVDEYSGKIANDNCPDDVVERTFISISDASAINWINNTGEGQAWASARNLQTPLQPPPTESCAPGEQRPTVIIAFPSQDMTVEGVLPLRGTVNMPSFSRYEIRYGISHNPEAFSEPLLVEGALKPDADSLLGQFDTRTIQNGPYTIRLVAIDQFGRRVTRDVRINVNNAAPTPAPIPTATLAPSLTPAGPESFATPAAGEALANPAEAPTLTPTWTLTPTPGGP